MSDISKKIFSIEPEPDEDPIALVPEPPETDQKTKITDAETHESEIDDAEAMRPPLLRTIVDIPAPLSRPIFELVEAIDEIEDKEDGVVERAAGPALNDTSEDDYVNDDSDDHHAGDIETDAAQSEEPLDADDATSDDQLDPIIRPLTDRAQVKPLKLPPAPPPIPMQASVTPSAYIAPASPAVARLGWVGPVLTVFTGLAISALVFVYATETPAISPLGLAALITAVIIPMIAAMALWITLRALAANRQETSRLAEVADRLTRADDAVTSDVARMSSAIKRELAQVDSRLAQSRDELDTLVALISRQSTEMNGMTQRLTDRSEMVAKTVTDQRDAFAGLSNDFETRMTALSQSLETQRDALDASSTAAAKRVGEASDALDHATKLTSDHSDAIARAATTANSSITQAEARLGALSDRITTQADELDAFYERRLTQLTDLSTRLSDDKGLAETALYSQSEKLSAVDAQLEITESRLTDLLDHAGQVQAKLTARLSDIDRTLSDADQRSRAFTADIADRVTDSVAQTRREISIMESELRALQSRMDGAKSSDLQPAESESPKTTAKRVHLTPLETDFPSLDLDDLAIPEAHDDDTLDLIEAIDDDQFGGTIHSTPVSSAEQDVVRRPGEDTGAHRVFGRGKPDKTDTTEKNWRWRDMLGSIDPIVDQDPSSALSNAPPPKPAPTVERPGPGVPLRAPTARAPQPEGSDVVARLCEVKLAPSTVVDDATISDATSARQSGGEAAQSRTVFTRLNSPVIHLRGVLSADLEFRLRAEGFRRSYNSYLSDMNSASRLRAELASANGRAYLLCAAALSAS